MKDRNAAVVGAVDRSDGGGPLTAPAQTAAPGAGELAVVSPGGLEMETVSRMMQEMIRPVVETLGKMVAANTAAMEQLAAAQAVQNDRLEALERQIRLNTPVTQKQAGYINQAVRSRARALMEQRELGEDARAVTKLAGMIRRALLAHYGVGSVREIPKHEYPVAMAFVEGWKDALAIREVCRGARER